MKGASKVIMGATLAMVISLAIVLCLVLVLLAELYCTLLLRRRNRHQQPQQTTTMISLQSPPQRLLQAQPTHSPLTTFFTPGVLHAPRSFLFPSSCKDAKTLQEPTKPEPTNTTIPPQKVRTTLTTSTTTTATATANNFVYISNPIYDNNVAAAGQEVVVDMTPFETPDTSPSRLEMGDGSSSSSSSPLTPMKKLPAEVACSVSLRDARSLLGTSGSDEEDDDNYDSVCKIGSSSSGSPSTSPSW